MSQFYYLGLTASHAKKVPIHVRSLMARRRCAQCRRKLYVHAESHERSVNQAAELGMATVVICPQCADRQQQADGKPSLHFMEAKGAAEVARMTRRG